MFNIAAAAERFITSRCTKVQQNKKSNLRYSCYDEQNPLLIGGLY